MSTDTKVDKLAVRFAVWHLRNLRKAQAEYEEAVRAWNVGPDRYLRFPHCIHGTSRWTDYDNICGPCEDGYTLLEIALGLGHESARTFRERSEIVGRLNTLGAPRELLSGLSDWALEPLSILPLTHHRPLYGIC